MEYVDKETMSMARMAIEHPVGSTWQEVKFASEITCLEAKVALLHRALKKMVDATESWDSAVEEIIGRQPQTGIDLQEAKKVLEGFPDA